MEEAIIYLSQEGPMGRMMVLPPGGTCALTTLCMTSSAVKLCDLLCGFMKGLASSRCSLPACLSKHQQSKPGVAPTASVAEFCWGAGAAAGRERGVAAVALLREGCTCNGNVGGSSIELDVKYTRSSSFRSPKRMCDNEMS